MLENGDAPGPDASSASEFGTSAKLDFSSSANHKGGQEDSGPHSGSETSSAKLGSGSQSNCTSCPTSTSVSGFGGCSYMKSNG